MIENWDHLRVVLAVARAGSLSRAGADLGVNHATVSRQLARCEEAAKATLFDRLPTGLRPTEAGETVIAHARDMEARLEVLSVELARHEEETGPLVISAPPLLIDATIAAGVAAYKRQHPAAEIELRGDNRIIDLTQREADIAIRVSRKPDDALWGRRVLSQRAGFYARPDWIAAQDWKDPTFALPIIGFDTWAEPVPEHVSQRYPNARVVCRTDDMIAAIALAREGLGAAWMPHFVGRRSEGLSHVAAVPDRSYADIWVLTHPYLKGVTRVRRFLTFIAEWLADRQTAFLEPE